VSLFTEVLHLHYHFGTATDQLADGRRSVCGLHWWWTPFSYQRVYVVIWDITNNGIPRPDAGAYSSNRLM
jgi:hypothetical protein